MSAVSIGLKMLVVAFAAWILIGPTTSTGGTAPLGVHAVGVIDQDLDDETGETGETGDQGADDVGEENGEQEAEEVDAELLYRTSCASCHARDGSGVEGRGPPLLLEGRAAADFVLRTGRMPLPDVDMQPVRKDPRFTEAEIVALVDYVGALGTGVDIPDVDPARGSVSNGAELYRLNCAACHVASGAGAVIGAGRTAPSLEPSTPTQVGEAIVVGPGAMPVFGALSSEDIDDISAYVVALQEEDTTGTDALGGVGPVAEGLAAWLLGVLPLVALTRWIGSPHEEADASGDDPIDDEPIDDDVVSARTMP